MNKFAKVVLASILKQCLGDVAPVQRLLNIIRRFLLS